MPTRRDPGELAGLTALVAQPQAGNIRECGGKMQPNQSLQQTLDPVATLADAKPAPASIAAEPRR